jgi:hypothetical protein
MASAIRRSVLAILHARDEAGEAFVVTAPHDDRRMRLALG